MSNRIMAAAIAVVVVALVGCTASRPASARPVAQVTTTAPDCGAPDVVAQLAVGHGGTRPATTPGRVPGGFVPATAVECTVAAGSATGSGGAGAVAPGRWRTGARESVDERRMSGDLAGLVTAVDRSSDRRADECPAMAKTQPVLYLVDAQGRAVQVAWPLDRCGYVQQRALDALDALHVDSRETIPAG